MEFLILLLVLGGGYFWLKFRSDKADVVKDKEVFSGRGVPLVKRSEAVASDDPTVNDNVQVTATVEFDQTEPAILNRQAEPAGSVAHSQSLTDRVSKQSIDKIPEDSVLRRHFLAQRDSEKQAITHPYPSDSVLRRHYLGMLSASLAHETIADVVADDVGAIFNSSKSVQKMPEDSVLKRHFMAQLLADIENSFYPCPTDSVLKRHYEHLIQAQISERLVEMLD